MKPIAGTLIAAAVAIAGIVPASALAATGTHIPASSSPVAAGRISTVAGGVGGPGPGRTVSVQSCGVTVAGRRVLLTDGAAGAVRQLNPKTGWLTTVAGNGTSIFAGDGGQGLDAGIALPCLIAVDAAGDVAVQEEQRVRLIAARTGQLFGQAMTAGHIYTVAGDGICCRPPTDGVPATSADFLEPDVAFDHAGNLLLAGAGNQLWVVAATSGSFYGQQMTAGDMYSVAGTGQAGFSGDGGPATAAMLTDPAGVALDPAGNIVVAGNNRIRVVAESHGTFYGIAMAAGDIYTIAGQRFGGYYGDGGPATLAELCEPRGLAFDRAGNVLIADRCDARIRVVAVRGGRFYGRAMKAGYIYSVAGGPGHGDGAPASFAGLSVPQSVAVDAAGNVLIGDVASPLRVVAEWSGRFYGRPMISGHIYDVAGGPLATNLGEPATRAEIAQPRAIADGPGGVIFAAGDHAYDLAAVQLLAGRSGDLFGQHVTAGDLYDVFHPKSGPPFLRNGGPTSGELCLGGLSQDRYGNVLMSDSCPNRVFVIPARAGRFYGRPMRTGHVYAIAGNGSDGNSGIGGWPTKAALTHLAGLTIDQLGDLVIVEEGLVEPGGYSICRVFVVASRTGRFYAVTMAAGHIYQVAGAKYAGNGPNGGPALNTRIDSTNVVADAAGNLVLADTGNNRLRVVARQSGTYYGVPMTAGHIYTIAGDNTAGFAGDGGPAAKAELNSPGSVAVDSAGSLIVADAADNRVRVIAERDGTFYGVPMAAGDIYTIAGNGTAGFAGDGGPATLAELYQPGAAAVAPGGVLISDGFNLRLRFVAG